ncbi:hypothetical protein QIS74_05650 [Colletotrichum tabaci]|uniref:Uncharacterized protein n=1 Tax=Colletotrichum tabaci TaxID=1209068 RepID=A0AAV9TJL5_9PEZI
MSLTFLDTPGTPPWSHISHPDHHRHEESENPMESLAARDQGAMAAAREFESSDPEDRQICPAIPSITNYLSTARNKSANDAMYTGTVKSRDIVHAQLSPA